MNNNTTNCTEHITKLQTDNGGTLPAYAWPGGYPMYYLDADNNVLCPGCAKNNDDFSEQLTAYAANWEDPFLYCDHCSERIESAYAED